MCRALPSDAHGSRSSDRDETPADYVRRRTTPERFSVCQKSYLVQVTAPACKAKVRPRNC